MFTITRFSRCTRGFLLLGICLLVLSALPARPAEAAKVTKRLDDSLPEFERFGSLRPRFGSF